MDLASFFQSKLTGSHYLVFGRKLPLDPHAAPMSLRNNLYFHWGCTGTVSSKHPNYFFFPVSH